MGSGFFLGLFGEHLSIDSRGPDCGNEGVLPFYVLHHAVIVCVGWFVTQWNLGILPNL